MSLTIPAGDRNVANLFLRCKAEAAGNCLFRIGFHYKRGFSFLCFNTRKILKTLVPLCIRIQPLETACDPENFSKISLYSKSWKIFLAAGETILFSLLANFSYRTVCPSLEFYRGGILGRNWKSPSSADFQDFHPPPLSIVFILSLIALYLQYKQIHLSP